MSEPGEFKSIERKTTSRQTKSNPDNSRPGLSERPRVKLTILKLKRESILLLLVCVILWAGQAVAAKVATNHLPPFQIMSLRFMMPIVCLGIISRWQGASLAVPPRMLPSILVNGSFLCLQISLFTIGTSLTSSAHSVVLIHSFPFFAALACHLFLPGLTLRPQFLAGFLIAFLGLVVVMSDSGELLADSNWLGDLLVVGAAATMGAKIALVKSMLARTTPRVMVFWECVTALPPVLILSLLRENIDVGEYMNLSVVIALLYQGVAVSTIAFLAWTRLLKMHDPGQLLVYRLLTPIVGVFLGWLLLGDQLTLLLGIGTALVISGVFFVSQQPLRSGSDTATQI